ncbi:MAG: folate family ECF transporter S component [Clostridia bacterium]|nr:folate family ECF transporter S component [Clostridia bacterium]
MKKSSMAFRNVRSLAVAAMLVSMSIVIGIFCKSVLNFGMGLFRVTFENLPIILGGILFGPIGGGLIGAASDLISYLLSGQAYPLNLIVTLGAVSVGVISGAVSRFVARKRGKLQVILSGGLAHAVGSMIIKPIGLFQFYGWMVLWRIPLYLIIAPIEICILCWLFDRSVFCRLIDGVGEEKQRRRSNAGTEASDERKDG